MLETGTQAAFGPAHRLHERHGSQSENRPVTAFQWIAGVKGVCPTLRVWPNLILGSRTAATWEPPPEESAQTSTTRS